MVAPPGLTSIPPEKVCKLKKALYGLKQASGEWFVKLLSFFLYMGYTQSMNDHSLFINSSEGSFTTLLIYVDDIILAGNDKEEIARIKQALNQTFKIKDLGNLRYFLGLEISSHDARPIGTSGYVKDYKLQALIPYVPPVERGEPFSSFKRMMVNKLDFNSAT